MKILADQNIPFAVDAFASISSTVSSPSEVILFDGRNLTRDELIDVDILMVRSVTQVNENLLAGSKVKFVGSATIGTDHIALDYLAKQGIQFANAPGCNATSASEYVVCGLLKYALSQHLSFAELNVAVIGHGNVGSRVVKKLSALGIKTNIYDPPQALEHNGNVDIRYVDWSTVKSCNVITAHVPLTTQGDYPTRLMFDAEFFSALVENSLFMNTSRGGAVDEAALLAQLQTKTINLILDVWQNEPAIDTNLVSKTLFSTSHIAGYSFDGKCRGTEMIYHAACDHFDIVPTWRSSSVKPEQQNNKNLEFVSSDVPGLVSLLSSAYSIEDDSQRLVATMSLDEEQRVRQFDVLRKNYPIRREFDFFQIKNKSLSEKDAVMLETLGFNLIS